MICDFFSGWLSGMIGFAVGYPFDTTKVQQQIYGSSAIKASAYIHRKKGFRGFYRGMMYPFLANGVLNAIFFGVYGEICDLLVQRRLSKGEIEYSVRIQKSVRPGPDPPSKIHHRNAHIKTKSGENNSEESTIADVVENSEARYYEMFIAGSIAGVSQLVFSAPIELVKVKLQSQMGRRSHRGPYHCMSRVYQSAGIRGFYTGWVPMAWRNVAGSAIHFTFLYPLLIKDSYNPETGQRKVHLDYWREILPTAGVAGVISWWFVMPFDVIKSRMQADSVKKPKYKSMGHCGSSILKAEGIRGLFTGFWSASLRAFPVNAVTFMTYHIIVEECSIFKHALEKAKSTISKSQDR